MDDKKIKCFDCGIEFLPEDIYPVWINKESDDKPITKPHCLECSKRVSEWEDMKKQHSK